ELGEGNDVAEAFRGARLSRLCPVRQREHPVEHADGDGGSADRTNTAGLERLIRLHADPALAVAVQVVLPLFRVELERPQETLAGPQGTHQAIPARLGVEEIGLPAELARRVRIRVGDQAVAIKGAPAPVHQRIGGEARLQGEDVRGQLLEAVFDPVEAGFGAEEGEPGGPDVGRYEKRLLGSFQEHGEQVLGIQAENGPPVRSDIADGRKLRPQPARVFQSGHADQAVHLPHLSMLPVDGADLGGQDESDFVVRRHSPFQGRARRRLLERVQPVLLHELLLKLGKPPGVGEIPGAHDPDSLDSGPVMEARQVSLPARGPRIPGVHVQVGNVSHADLEKIVLISSLAPSSTSPYFTSSWERYWRIIDWNSGSAAGLIFTGRPICRDSSSSFFFSFREYWRSTVSTRRLRSPRYSLKKPSSWLNIVVTLRASVTARDTASPMRFKSFIANSSIGRTRLASSDWT